MNCHRLINIPVDTLIKDISMIPRLPDNKELWTTHVDPKLFLTDIAYDKLSALGSLVGLVFEMNPKADKKSIHVDLIPATLEPAWSGLNIVLEGQGVMKWFKPKTPGYLIKRENTRIAYQAWFNDYGEPVDVWSHGKIALVRTDIPHQVWNYDDTNRFIVSIRWSNRTTWEETIEWFNKNFLPSTEMSQTPNRCE
jgi:hypothetical protein